MDHHQDFFFGDLLSDDSEKGSNAGDYPSLREMIGGYATSSLAESVNFWIHGFWGVSRANYALEGLPTVSWDSGLRDRLIGEALFLRAFNYWYLVRIFGGVPLFTESVQPSQFGNVKRASVNECYAQMAKDLKEAIRLLPERSGYDIADAGRATKGAAKALLARIYMYQIGTDIESTVKWDEVYNLTSEVINSGEYKLLDNYAMLFETENKNTVESVFEIQFAEGSSEEAPGSVGTNFYNFQGNRKDDSGWGFNNPSIDLVNSFEPGDPRLSNTIYGETYNGGVLYGEKKKYDRNEQCSDWLNRKAALPAKPALAKACDRNRIIIRYADVLLMNAEAAYYTGKSAEAIARVNQVRERARNSTFCKGYVEGKKDYSGVPTGGNSLLADIKNLSGEALLEAIWKERRVELAMEQLRFFDLVRTGRFIKNMSVEKDTKRMTGGEYESLYRYENIGAMLESKCFDGPNGHKVYVDRKSVV